MRLKRTRLQKTLNALLELCGLHEGKNGHIKFLTIWLGMFWELMCFCWNQFSGSVMSDSLWPHEPQHNRPPVYHQLPESTRTHVCWVGDAVQSPYSLSSPSPPAFNLSHHQGLFKWVSSSHQVAKVLEFQLQHQSFQWTFRTDFF